MTCVFIFQAGGQCKVLAGLAEMVHELLRVFGEWAVMAASLVGKEEITQIFHLEFALVWRC